MVPEITLDGTAPVTVTIPGFYSFSDAGSINYFCGEPKLNVYLLDSLLELLDVTVEQLETT